MSECGHTFSPDFTFGFNTIVLAEDVRGGARDEGVWGVWFALVTDDLVISFARELFESTARSGVYFFVASAKDEGV